MGGKRKLESFPMVIVRVGVDWFLFSQYLMVRSRSNSSFADSLRILAARTASLREKWARRPPWETVVVRKKRCYENYEKMESRCAERGLDS